MYNILVPVSDLTISVLKFESDVGSIQKFRGLLYMKYLITVRNHCILSLEKRISPAKLPV